jgi:hypothetical protein
VTKRAGKTGRAKGGAGQTDLLEEIEQRVESAVRELLAGDIGVSELIKIRDVVREILAERPHEVVVRWVDTCETSQGETELVEAKEEADGDQDSST